MIHVVTAVHNRMQITKKFAEVLNAQTIRNKIHLLLVDDGCTDDTVSVVKSIFSNITVIRGDGNLWWGGALDKAYHWLQKNADLSDIVLISNDDVQYGLDYIEIGVRKLNGRENVLLSGLAKDRNSDEIYDTPLKWDFENLKAERTFDKELANCVSTRSLFMRVSTLVKVGGFHPILLPHYASDYEWTIRAVRKGCRIECEKDLTYYASFESTGNRKRNITKMFSKKSNYNPIYRLTFILLTTPISKLPKAFSIQFARLIKG